MKLNKREIILVATLVIVLGSIGYYKYIIVPQIAIASSSSIKREEKRKEFTRFKTDVASQDKLEGALMKLQEDFRNETKNYYLTLEQAEIILLLNDFGKETNVKVDGIEFEEPRVEILTEEEDPENPVSEEPVETKQENTEEKEDKKEEDTGEVETTVQGEEEEDDSDHYDVYTVSLEYESNYSSLIELLTLITSYEKRIMIKDININKENEEETKAGILKGNIKLDFYVIGKILDEKDKEYAWGANQGSASSNPFSEFNGYYIPSEIEAETKVPEEDKEDKSDSEKTETAEQTESKENSESEDSLENKGSDSANTSNSETSTDSNTTKSSESNRSSNSNDDPKKSGNTDGSKSSGASVASSNLSSSGSSGSSRGSSNTGSSSKGDGSLESSSSTVGSGNSGSSSNTSSSSENTGNAGGSSSTENSVSSGNPGSSDNTGSSESSSNTGGTTSTENSGSSSNTESLVNSGNVKPPTSEDIKPSVDSDKEDEPTIGSKELFTFEELKTIKLSKYEDSDKEIKGSLSLDKDRKTQGGHSLNLKYDFVKKRQHSVANITFNEDVIIKHQVKMLSLAVKPIKQNNNALGIVVEDREGTEYKLPLTKNLSWDGWKRLLVKLPLDIKYPATVKKIYVESTGFNEDLEGDLLIDNLRIRY